MSEDLFREMENLIPQGYIREDKPKGISFVDDVIDKLRDVFSTSVDFMDEHGLPFVKHVFTHLPLYALYAIRVFIAIPVLIAAVGLTAGIITNGNADWIIPFCDKYMPYPFKWTCDNVWLKFGTIVTFFYWQKGCLQDWLLDYTRYSGFKYKLQSFITTCAVGYFVYTWFVPELYTQFIGWFMGLTFTCIILGGVGAAKHSGPIEYSAPGDKNVNSTTMPYTETKIDKRIDSAVQRGNCVTIDSNDYRGDQMVSGRGWSRPGNLISFSENRVVIQNGNFIETYDVNGNKISCKSTKY